MASTPPNPPTPRRSGSRSPSLASLLLALPPPAQANPDRVDSHRFLRRTLHGESTPGTTQPTYWDGTDTVGDTFRELFELLNDSVPPSRPGGAQQGVAVRRYTRR